MAHDVFISYASEDKTIADAVCAGLEKEGVRCWIAPRDILTSEDYDDAIIKAINSARVMVVIFSSNIFQSQFVKSEVERAFSKSLIIAPFRIENVAPQGGLELYLGRKHWLDAMTPPLEAHIHTLASSVRSMLAAPSLVSRLEGYEKSEAQTPQPQTSIPQGTVQALPGSAAEQAGKHAGRPGRRAGWIAAAAVGVGLIGLLCVAILVFLMIKNLNGNSAQALTTITPQEPAFPGQNTPGLDAAITKPSIPPTSTPSPNLFLTTAPTSSNGEAASTPAGNTVSSGGWISLIDQLPRALNAFAIDPANPNIVYAASGDFTGAGAGVYKSEDAGITWFPAKNGLPNESVVALTILPDANSTILASLNNGNGIYASSDKAGTWSLLGKPSGGGGATAVMFAISADKKSIYVVVSDQGVMRSDNGGQSWTPSNEGLPKDSDQVLVLTLAVDPGDPNILYAGTGGFVGQGAGVYKSTDGGDSWSAANKGMLDYRITALAVDPRQPQTIYAGSDRGDLFKSTDAGQNWIDFSDRIKLSQFGPYQVRSIQIDPDSGRIYLLADDLSVVYSDDGGNRWSMLGSPGGIDQPRFSCMAVLFGEKPVILMATIDNERAKGWRYSVGAPAPVSAATPAFAAATPGTIQTLSGNWQQLTELPRAVNSLVVDPTNPNLFFAGIGGVGGAGGGVYKSEDTGLTWKNASEGLNNNGVTALAFTNGSSPVLYATGGSGGDVYTSQDGARTWSALGKTGLFSSFEQWISIAPSDSNIIFTLTNSEGAVRTDDGGQSWIPLGEGIPQKYNKSLVLSIAVDPSDPKVVYAGTGGFVGNGQGVYKSTDGGDNWSPANKGMLDYQITALAVDPLQPQIVYAGSDSGNLFKSADGGENWTNLSDRLKLTQSAGAEIHNIQIDPVNGLVYVLTDYAGVLYSGDGGSKWRMLGIPAALNQPRFAAMAIAMTEKPVIILACQDEKGTWRFSAAP
jgi:photosystem II stability/assembly factor-like uncharacterized protein